MQRDGAEDHYNGGLHRKMDTEKPIQFKPEVS